MDPTVPVRGGYIDLLILSLDEKCEVEESLNGSAGESEKPGSEGAQGDHWGAISTPAHLVPGRLSS